MIEHEMKFATFRAKVTGDQVHPFSFTCVSSKQFSRGKKERHIKEVSQFSIETCELYPFQGCQ